MESQYILANICVRKDGPPPYRQLFLHVKNNVDDAIEYLQQELERLESYYDINSSDELLDHLKKGKAVWVWEWERKGNGDYYKIINKSICPEFEMGLDIEPSKDIGEFFE